ncbi:MAG TPA: HNH endonuclease signature motif containing protein [Polyangiaceae bacterium]|nr:HNH endonuclease signature motif containing protein [Polyangiaceae bacterium]
MIESAACRDSAAQKMTHVGVSTEPRRGADWQRAHEELRRLARSRAGLDFEEGQWLLAAWRGGVHGRLGYGSFREYIERLFGYGSRLVQDKLRVAEALEQLPVLARALQDGLACWSVLRELTRVATLETEAEWLAAAAGRTVREVEQLVSGHGPGSRPGDPCDAAMRRHVLRFEVSGEVLASVREALSKLRRDAGEPLDDDAALLLMARAVLEGPTDSGKSSYQLALTVCEHCRRGTVQGSGEPIQVEPEVAEMAACDAQQLGRLDQAPMDAHAGAHAAPLPRATQTIPPAVRRHVLRRDHGRCVVPGCRHATYVDLHHLVTRAEGGQHDSNLLVTLCGAHHRAVHRGTLIIEGAVSQGLTFRHADGSAYGGLLAVAHADATAQAFQALCHQGFREGEVRRALTELTLPSGTEPSVEALIRQGVLRLTERHVRARG